MNRWPGAESRNRRKARAKMNAKRKGAFALAERVTRFYARPENLTALGDYLNVIPFWSLNPK